MPSHLSIKDSVLALPPANLHKPLLRKRHSWPPLSAKPRAKSFDEVVNENPFSHFVSDPAEKSEAYLSGLTAGIDDKPRSRSYSPRQRVALLSSVVTSSPTNKLKRWIEKMESYYSHRSPRNSPPFTQRPIPLRESLQPSKTPLSYSPPTRGRGNIRVGSTHRVTANSRSKPRRPRAWKAPSAEIWPVVEDDEEENFGLGILVPR